ncbi:MAG: ribulose-phosphate 3-epimerase [Ruminococcaceae bacterium]|nr:ribulose-phosphate 3-epimerase [Oscillospiraceae bacterium]
MKVSPSILTCDFAHGADELRFVEQSGADMVHLDVMDGVFVPNLSFGPPVIAALRPCTDLFFDVHLMMQHPRRLVPAFVKAGSDLINIHLECADDIAATLKEIRDAGKQAAITLKPATPAEAAFPYLTMVDMVLVMTVEPGFGGQSFMADMMPKVTALRQEIDRLGLSVSIQVDGGINADTAVTAAQAGADIAVIGSALFNAQEPKALVDGVHTL